MKQKLLNVAVQTSCFKSKVTKWGDCEFVHQKCLSCGEHITHPLCPECIADGFREWVLKFPNIVDEVLDKLDIFLVGHKKMHGKSKSCISCGKHQTYLCPYCFTEYLLDLLKEVGASVEAIGEFLFMFNYDFEHKGYYLEGEELGVF